MALRAKDADFENFASQARSLLGNDLTDDWLQEMWSGADGDLNRALNHVLDSPPDKVGRSGGSVNAAPVASTKAKSPKKKKHSKSAAAAPRPAPPAPAWDDEYDDPFFSAPAPVPTSAAPVPPPPPEPVTMQQQPPAPQGMSSQQMPAPSSAPQLMGPQMGMQYQQVPYPSATQQQSPQMMQTMPTMPSAYGMMDNTPMNTAPNPGMAASLQHQQRMQFIQSQQQQVLITLKTQLDTVLANPNLLQDVAAMHQLKDTMSMAMEAPNATIQMDEQTRQNEQAAQFIRFMQSQISEMLTNPRVASNPELLQQLNTQMNQLRLITMQQVASEQLSTNPVTALSLATAPNSGAKTLTTDDIRSILESAMLDSESEDSEDDEDSEEGEGGSDDATEWWGDDIPRKGGKGDMMQNEKHVSFGEGSPKKGCMKKGSDPSLSESNPFKEPEGEDETIPGDKKVRNSSRTLRNGRKASRKSGSSDEKSLTKWMKQLMAAQSQLGSSASMPSNTVFPNNSTPVLPSVYHMSQGAAPLPMQSMPTVMPPSGYPVPSTAVGGVPPMTPYPNPPTPYPQQQQPPYY